MKPSQPRLPAAPTLPWEGKYKPQDSAIPTSRPRSTGVLACGLTGPPGPVFRPGGGTPPEPAGEDARAPRRAACIVVPSVLIA